MNIGGLYNLIYFCKFVMSEVYELGFLCLIFDVFCINFVNFVFSSVVVDRDSMRGFSVCCIFW